MSFILTAVLTTTEYRSPAVFYMRSAEELPYTFVSVTVHHWEKVTVHHLLHLFYYNLTRD